MERGGEGEGWEGRWEGEGKGSVRQWKGKDGEDGRKRRVGREGEGEGWEGNGEE